MARQLVSWTLGQRVGKALLWVILGLLEVPSDCPIALHP